MNYDQITSLIRSVLLSAGTLLAANGIAVTGTQWEAIVGGLMAVGAVVWSQFFHRSAA